MEKDQNFNLARHILSDLLNVGRMPLFLSVLILLSALAVVLVTHNTRELISLREQLLLQQDALDIEWRNQLLEESALTEHSRVEELAEDRLLMQRPATDQEVIVY
ncbi:cell division protein FtsL [Thaumasiovibrio sp. DFM-14]|uniref:cell division protein FtsL n=1 Tax=Thaumasiovibrio sp. DFM-14 TaxID=3384792 RepID=UPI0039A34585